MRNRVGSSGSSLPSFSACFGPAARAFALAGTLLLAACGSDDPSGVAGERGGPPIKGGDLGTGTTPAPTGTNQPAGSGSTMSGGTGAGGASGAGTPSGSGGSAGTPSGSGGSATTPSGSGGSATTPSGSGGVAGGEPAGSGGTSGGGSPQSIVNTCHIVAFAMCNRERECLGKGLEGIEVCEKQRRTELRCADAVAINPEIDECLRQTRAASNCPFMVPAICKMAFTYK